MVLGPVSGDAEDPGFKRRATFKVIYLVKYLEVNILGNVFGVLLVGNQTVDE